MMQADFLLELNKFVFLSKVTLCTFEYYSIFLLRSKSCICYNDNEYDNNDVEI